MSKKILFIVLFAFVINNCIAGDKRSLVSRVVTSGPTKRLVEKGLTKVGILKEDKDDNSGDQGSEPKEKKEKIILTDRQLAEEKKKKVEAKLEKGTAKGKDLEALTAENVLLEGFIRKDVEVE